MKTFFAWAIANLEIIGCIILAPFIWICLSRHPELGFSDYSTVMTIVVISFFIAIAGGAPWTSGSFGDVFNIVLTIAGVSYLLYRLGIPEDSFMTHLIIAGIIGLVSGIAIAIYAVSNFYEVVSFRWIFNNSNASKFEVSALYGFGRFCLGFHIGAFAYGLLL